MTPAERPRNRFIISINKNGRDSTQQHVVTFNLKTRLNLSKTHLTPSASLGGSARSAAKSIDELDFVRRSESDDDEGAEDVPTVAPSKRSAVTVFVLRGYEK